MAVARSIRQQSVHASRLWQAVVSMEARCRPISTISADMQDQHPAGVAKEQTLEAEPVDIPIPTERTKGIAITKDNRRPGMSALQLLVLGGNGFVGSHVCKEALDRGLPVLSLNRSGKPAVHEPWVNDVNWIQGSLFQSEKWREHLSEVTAVISCVGGFGTNDQMRKINGDANISAINTCAETGVERFVYVSAADFNIPFVLRGYYEGKKAAEEALRSKFPYSGVILRPGFIHGTRRVGNMKVPLSVIGGPLESLFRNMKSATQIPGIGPLLIPPVKVTAVAKTAVRAAVDNAIPPGALDVWAILKFGGHP